MRLCSHTHSHTQFPLLTLRPRLSTIWPNRTICSEWGQRLMRKGPHLRGWEMLLGGFSRARNTVKRLRTGTRAHVFVYPCFTDHLGCSKCWVMHCRKRLCVLFVHYQTGINENRVTHYQAHVIDRECVCVCVCEGVTPWKSCMWQLHCSLSVVINIQPVSNSMQHFCVQSAL